MIFRGINSLIIDRPLVFLCGCAVDDKNRKYDRREILRRAIQLSWKNNNDIKCIPLIVDNLFKEEYINYYKLRVNLLEEIVTNISYITYIFLDTMSTSYELGQFTNFSYSKNKVRVLVDSEYENRNNCKIGNYIKLSFDGKFVKYKAKYNPSGHITFEKKKVPQEIKKIINSDNPVKNGYKSSVDISFSNKTEDIVNGVFRYKIDSSNIYFSCNIFTLFYFVTGVYFHYKNEMHHSFDDIKGLESNAYKNFYNLVLKEIYRTFLFAETSINRKCVFVQNMKYSLYIDNFDSFNLVYHCLALSLLLPRYKTSFKYFLGKPFQSINFGDYMISPLSTFLPSFNTIIKETYNYKDRTDWFYRKTLSIKGKKRNILTYTNDYIGNRMRSIHKLINEDILSLLPSSSQSFAYKPKLNPIKCVNEHFGNVYFIKLDIKDFFNSIKYSLLFDKISDYFYERISVVSLYAKSRVRDDIRRIIKTLFANYKLPIGFVCSPRLSDYYLFEFDKTLSALKGVKYTRYADDILISSLDKEIVYKTYKMIKYNLLKLGLDINQKKVITKSLINNNDSIKFLNINIIRRNESNYELSISKKYLEDTANLISKDIKTENLKNVGLISGRCSYIKSVSIKSYNKLTRILRDKYDINTYSFEYYYHLSKKENWY